MDARAVAGSRIAAVGPATAKALERYGIRADLVPSSHTAASLAESLVQTGKRGTGQVLFPQGNLAGDSLSQELRRAGAAVDRLVVYNTFPMSPPPRDLEAVKKGIDAAIFYSPSAVRQFRKLWPEIRDFSAICIGPTTAETAAALGLATVQSASTSTRDILAALA
jgi:uroporphyrinogen III methyltransferase/synthase